MDKETNTENYWNKYYSENNDIEALTYGFRNLLYEKIVDIVFSIRHNRILDLGCGLSPISYLMKKRDFDFSGRKYMSMDFSKVALKFAKERNSMISTIQHRVDGDIKCIQPSNFDIVICCGILEFVSNYILVLKNVHKFLFDYGTGIVIVPTGSNKNYYHSHLPLDLINSAHEAVDLIPYSITYIKNKRWIIIKSRKRQQKGSPECP